MSYPTDTLLKSVRQKPTERSGWHIVDDDGSSDAEVVRADPALTAAAIMKDALAAMLAQANVGRQDALVLLLR